MHAARITPQDQNSMEQEFSKSNPAFEHPFKTQLPRTAAQRGTYIRHHALPTRRDTGIRHRTKAVPTRRTANAHDEGSMTTASETADHNPPLAHAIRAALQDMPRCRPSNTKDHIRAMHTAARLRHLKEHEQWTRNAWRLRQRSFANGAGLDPAAISPRMIPVVTTEQQDLFRLARYT